MENLKDGYYWVRIREEWIIVKLEIEDDGRRNWWFTGWEVPEDGRDFDEVDPTPITRNV